MSLIISSIQLPPSYADVHEQHGCVLSQSVLNPAGLSL